MLSIFVILAFDINRRSCNIPSQFAHASAQKEEHVIINRHY